MAAALQTYGSVWLKHLPPTATDASVRELFKGHGKVLKAVAKATEDGGECTGNGYVIFQSTEDAKKAIAGMHGTDVGGALPLIVAMTESKQQVSSKATMLCVRYLSENATSKSLRALFAPHDPILKALVQKRVEDGVERILGFITFPSKEAAAKAAKAARKLKNGGQRLKAILLEPRESEHKSRLAEGMVLKAKAKLRKPVPKQAELPADASLWVKNLPADATSASVKELFDPHGTVLKATAKATEDGKCTGNGYVIFKFSSEAAAAMAALSGKDAGGEKPLSVMIAGPPKDPAPVVTMICVRHLSEHTTAKHLRALFKLHGTVLKTAVQKRTERGREGHYGFLAFPSKPMAAKAAAAAGSMKIGDRALKAMVLEPRAGKSPRKEGIAARAAAVAAAPHQEEGPLPTGEVPRSKRPRGAATNGARPGGEEGKRARQKLQHQHTSAFCVGDRVRYWSGTGQRWVEAIVQKIHPTKGTYDLSCKKGVEVKRLRRADEGLPPVKRARLAEGGAALKAGHYHSRRKFRRKVESHLEAAERAMEAQYLSDLEEERGELGAQGPDTSGHRNALFLPRRQRGSNGALNKAELEEEVITAIRFLRQSKVASRPAAAAGRFLLRQGLSKESIVEAFRCHTEAMDGFVAVVSDDVQHSGDSDAEIPEESNVGSPQFVAAPRAEQRRRS